MQLPIECLVVYSKLQGHSITWHSCYYPQKATNICDNKLLVPRQCGSNRIITKCNCYFVVTAIDLLAELIHRNMSNWMHSQRKLSLNMWHAAQNRPEATLRILNMLQQSLSRMHSPFSCSCTFNKNSIGHLTKSCNMLIVVASSINRCIHCLKN